MQVETEIEIAAPPERVWDILVSRDALLDGGFGITRLEGRLSLGASFKLWSEVAPDRAFRLRVTEFEAPRLMVWEGGMPFGLFKGRRSFALTPINQGTRFHMKEVFTGGLSGVITRSMPDLTPSFEKFALALKHAAEEGTS